MSIRSAQSVTVLFTTRNATTGVGVNADSLPSGTIYVNGTADAASVTVTNVSTGLYKAAVTLPTLAVGDEVEMVISATVNAISDKAVIWGDTKDLVIDSAGLADANMVKVGPSGSGTAQTAADIYTKLLKFIQLALRKDSAIATDNATELTAINANGGSGAGTYANTTESLAIAADSASSALGYATRTAIRGTVGVGSTTTSIVTSALDVAGVNAAQLTGRVLIFENPTATGALNGCPSPISAITVGATPTITVAALPVAPSSGDKFTIV